MAKKKKQELTDEEWAQLVADKVHEKQAAVQPPAPEPPQELTALQRMGQEARSVLGIERPEDLVRSNNDVRIDTVDAAGRSRLEAKQADGSMIRTPLTDAAGEKALAGGSRGGADQLPSREGVIYLANTDKNGNQTKGQMVARKMFATDAEFDKFVANAKEQGNLWQEPQQSAESDKKGGGFLSNIKSSLGTLMTQATPDGSGGGGGGGGVEGGYQSPDARGQSVGQVVANPAAVTTQPTPGYATELGAAQMGVLGADGAGGGGGSNGPLQTGAQGNSGLPAPGERVTPNPLPGMIKAAGAGVGSLISGQPWDAAGVMQREADFANRPTPLAPATQQPPPQIPDPRAGMSASASGPLGNAPGFPKPNDLSPEIRSYVDQQKDAMNAQAELTAEFEKTRSAMINSQMDEIAKRQQSFQQQTEYVNARAKELFDTTAQAQKILNSPAKTPDPERYWKSHNKIMFAIGVGLLAQAKGDIGAVLNSVNAAIDRDIEAQKAEFEAPVKAARNQVAGAANLYGMLRDMGHDAFEALKVGGALGDQFYAKQYEQLAANSNSELVKQRALEESGKLAQSAAEKMQEADTHRRTVGVSEYNARTNRMETTAKISQNAGVGRKLTENEAKNIEFSREGVTTIDKILGVLGKESTLTEALAAEVMKSLPLVMTDAKAASNAVDALNFALATSLSKSSLQAHEQKKWLGEDGKGGILGNVGLRNMSQQQYRELRQLLVDSAAMTARGGLPQGEQPLPPSAQRVR